MSIQQLKKWILKFFSIDDTPHHIAGGAAVGFFLGITPGEGILATIVTTSILRFNRTAGIAGVLATNMWMTVVTLPLAAAVGGALFGVDSKSLINQFDQSYQLGWQHILSKVLLMDVALPLLTGFVIVAGIISLAFYFILLTLLIRHKIKVN
ncbi:DUF2062 domain-containing protein [Patescibacteria group bacterium]|nr:MAG: DUF2062 domain-containing protein [Patescibacteria group bacterium]